MQRVAGATGFTLIELLVVITIIVVLLALLAPALDRAIYQAELLQCGGNIRAGVSAGQQYAFEYRRAYPRQSDSSHMPNFVRPHDNSYNLVKSLRPYIGIGAFLDPFTGDIDLSEEANDAITQLVANQNWYYDWGGANWKMQRTMKRVGDRMRFDRVEDDGSGISSALVSDFDMYSITWNQFFAGHPDDEATLSTRRHQNENNPFFFNLPTQKVTLHWWEGDETPRGALDTNYGFDDGSVERYAEVTVNDPRMNRVQDAPNGGEYFRGQNLPRNR